MVVCCWSVQSRAVRSGRVHRRRSVRHVGWQQPGRGLRSILWFGGQAASGTVVQRPRAPSKRQAGVEVVLRRGRNQRGKGTLG